MLTGSNATMASAAPAAAVCPLNINLYAFDENNLVVKNITTDINSIQEYFGKMKVVWVDVAGKLTVDQLDSLFKIFNIDPIEAGHLEQPSALKSNLAYYPAGILKLGHMLYFGDNFEEQYASFFLGQNFLLTLHFTPCDAITTVVSCLGDHRRAIRYGGPDYTLYYILLNIISGYLQEVRRFGDGIDELEDALVVDPDAFAMSVFFNLRKRLTGIKRKLWLQRDLLSQLNLLDDHPKVQKLITPLSLPGYKSCYERTSDVLDLLDSHIDHCRGLLDIYFSSTSNQMNQIMKTLTIFSAIFLPLSFLAGLWGMNFDYNISRWNMPELKFYYGYPMALAIMLTIAIVLLVIFTRIGWLSFGRNAAPKEQVNIDF